MARYYFHLVEHEDLCDPEGKDLPDLDAAREYALDSARDVVCGCIKEGWLNLDHRIEVTNEAGEAVLTLTFRDAFTING